MMKILYISDAKSIHTQRWAEYFLAQGYDVKIASFRDNQNSNAEVIVLKNYGFGKLGYFFAIAQIKDLCKKFQPDIVHAQYITSYGFLSAMANCHPLIMTAWGSDVLVSPKESFISKKLVEYALNKATMVTTVAEHMNKSIYEYCTNCIDVQAMPFGVDLSIFKFTKYKQPSNILRIISTRNFTPIYSIDTLIQSIDILNKQGIEVHLDLVGDGILKDELSLLVNSLNLENRVIFHGHIQQSRMVSLLQEADIFISTAISDGNNISLNEAMACGCFPIATNIPANQQWIASGHNGFLFEIYDYTELANSIIKYTKFNDKESVINSNRKIVEAKANWDKCTIDMKKKYTALIGH